MALSSSELYLVLRARDEASRILRNFSGNVRSLSDDAMKAAQAQFAQGQALATAGVAVAGAGLLGAAALNSMADAASVYNQQAAYTMTQTDGVKTSIEELKDIGREVAREVPVAFDEIQTGLYDIFSSIETTMPEAKQLIRDMAEAAVGGQVDISTATRGTVGILNAYKLEAKDATRVNDVLFQLTRKGVGTYEEFVNNIGKSVPSAAKAGQSVESLAGMMAFLTRNGMSVAMSSTSAARAMDALANPESIQRLEDYGVEITRADGSFRDISDIMVDMRGKMAGLSEEAKASKLKELFGGSGGTIQAMRFFNTGMADSNNLLGTMTDYMNNAEGAAGEAYAIMSNTPQAELQRLTNNFEVLKTEIGDQVLPMKVKLMQTIVELMGKFEDLPGPIKNNIGVIAALVSGFLILVGVVMMVAGVWLMFSAGVVLAGTTMAAVLTPVALVIAGIAALIAIGVLIYKNWDTIKAKAMEVWDGYIFPAIQRAKEIFGQVVAAITPLANTIRNDLVDAAIKLWEGFKPFLDSTIPLLKDGFNSVKEGVLSFWNTIKTPLAQLGRSLAPFGDAIIELATRFWEGLKPIVNFIVAVLGPVFGSVFALLGPVVKGLGSAIGAVFKMLGEVFRGIINAIKSVIDMIIALVNGDWKMAWESFKGIFIGLWDAIFGILRGAWNIISGLIKGLVQGIIDFFKNLYDELVGNSIIPDLVNGILSWIGSLPGKVLDFIRSLVVGAIQWFLTMKDNVTDFIVKMVLAVRGHWANFKAMVMETIISVVSFVISKVSEWKNNFVNTVSGMINDVINFFTGLPGRIRSAISGIGTWLYESGRDLIRGMINGVQNMAGNIADKAKEVVGGAITAAKNLLDITSPSKVFRWIGEMTGQGFVQGLHSMLSDVASAGNDLAEAVLPAPPVVPLDPRFGGPGSPDWPPGGPGGAGGAQLNLTVNTPEIDPVKMGAELGFIILERVGDA